MFNNYITASARLRAIESEMINEKDIERMLNSSNAKEAFDVLQDSSFSSFISGVSYKDFESSIDKYLQRVKKTIILSCPQWEVVELISVWYDFINIKLALKSFLKGDSFDNILHNMSQLWGIELLNIKDFAYENGKITEDLTKLRSEIISDYNKNSDLKKVDIACDKLMFKNLLNIARKIDSKIISDFLKKRIDIINIITYLRIQQKHDLSYFIDWWDINCWLLWSNNKEEISSMIKYKFNIDINLSEDISSFLKISSQFNIELNKSLDWVKYLAYGQEVIFAHFWMQVKSTEIIRTILVWKINDIDKQTIRNHLRKIH